MRALAVLWSIGTAVALWMPPPDTPGLDWPWLDKAVHFGLFGVAASLWRLAGAGLGGLALGITLGAALTELGQGMLPWPRTPDALDFGFDLVGAALGVAATAGARALTRRISRSSRIRGSQGGYDDAPGAPEASWRNGRDSNPR